MCKEIENLQKDYVTDTTGNISAANTFWESYNNPNTEVNLDLCVATLNKLDVVAKKKNNIIELFFFSKLIKSANEKQKEFLIHITKHVLSANDSPLQIFLHSPLLWKNFCYKINYANI